MAASFLQPKEDFLSDHYLNLFLGFVKGAAPKWREIGLALGFSTDVLDAIAAKPENMSRGPIACFTDLLSRWLKWAPPNHDFPTVKMLAEALRSGTVGEERIAYDLEQGFERTPSSAVTPVPQVAAQSQPSSGASPNTSMGETLPSQLLTVPHSTSPLTSTGIAVNEPSSFFSTHIDHQSADTATPISPATPCTSIPSVEEVQAKIHEFEQQFNALKTCTREVLELHGIDVKTVVECLTEISEDDMPELKMFLNKHMEYLLKAKDLFQLFLRLNLYWNYLAYHLLEHLIKKFSVEEVKGEMKKYKSNLGQFMLDTPLEVFRRGQKERVLDIPEGFEELVTKFEWPQKVPLAVVEEFRQLYANHYTLHDFTAMLIKVLPG